MDILHPKNLPQNNLSTITNTIGIPKFLFIFLPIKKYAIT